MTWDVRRIRRLVALITTAGLLVLGGVPAAALESETCEPVDTVNVLAGVSRSEIIGVVEFEVIGTGVVSTSSIVGATRRIWGDVLVERWVAPSEHQVACTGIPTATGSAWYRFVSRSGIVDDLLPAEPTGLDLDALAVVLTEPVSLEISGIDRVMAFLRVNWALIAIGGLALVSAVGVVARRRSGRDRGDYLF